MAKRTSRGRQRVEMKKLQNKEQLQVTFSRRRLGLFKLADQMCILTGAQVALIVFSPSDRVFPFGSPNVEAVIDRYEDQSRQPRASHHVSVQSAQTNQEKLNRELSVLENKVEGEKKRRALLDQMIEEHKNQYWWEAPIEELDLNQLEELLRAKQRLYDDVTREMHTMLTYYLDSQGNATNPSRVNGVSSPIMGRYGFNQMAPFDTRAPATVDFYHSAAVPSIIDGVSSLNVGDQCRSNGLAHFDSRESGIASAVEYASSSRTNGASEMVSGASSSNPMGFFDSMAPRFDG